MSSSSPLGFAPGNWVSRAAHGSWTSVTLGISGVLTVGVWFLTLIFFGTFTTYIQGAQGFGIGLFYMLGTSFALYAWWIETSDKKTANLAVIDFGPLHRLFVSVPIGLALGLGFTVLLRYSVGAFIPFEQVQFLGIPIKLILNIVGPVIAIPIAEEAFFGGVMTPTFSEIVGIIPGAILVSLTWVIWHLGTYGQDIPILVAIFAFRMVATFAILWTKSLVPSVIAHIIINFFGTFFTV